MTIAAEAFARMLEALADVRVREEYILKHPTLQVLVCPARDHLIVIEPDAMKATMFNITVELMNDWEENVQSVLDLWTKLSTEHIQQENKNHINALFTSIRAVLADPDADCELHPVHVDMELVEHAAAAAPRAIAAFIERNAESIYKVVEESDVTSPEDIDLRDAFGIAGQADFDAFAENTQ